MKIISKINKLLFKIAFFIIVIIFNCSFEPTDLIFKNIKLIPELLDNEDRTPHLPKKYVNEKTEKLVKQPKLPSGEQEAPAEKILSVNDILNNTIITTGDDLKNLVPTMESIDTMFNLSNIGIIKPSDGKSKKKDSGISIDFLEPATKKLPILNDLPGVKQLPKKIPIAPGLNKGASGKEIKNPIKDLQINGIDDVLPNAVGAPLKPSDYDFNPYIQFFDDFISEEYNLDQNITDILP